MSVKKRLCWHVTKSNQILFTIVLVIRLCNKLVVVIKSALYPIYFFAGLYWRIHQIDFISALVFFVAITALSTYLMAMAYRNTKFALKHKVAVKREEAVTREVTKQLSDDKKTSRKEKDERTLWKKNEVADYEATNFAIFYNNALFLAIVIFVSFFIFRSTSPLANYILTVSGSSGILALLSTSKQT